MVLVHVYRFHQPTNKTTHAQSIQTSPTVHAQSAQTKSTVPRAIRPNETVGAAPVCPPERPRSGVSITKMHALCAGNERWMRPCRATRAGTQAPPLPISTKPRGVPLPHRGYTFDSAGLASVTQPTLGNDVSEEATPLGVVLFLITHHHHTSSSHSGEWIICE